MATWLPSSNREANLRGHERLKDQLREKRVEEGEDGEQTCFVLGAYYLRLLA